MNREKVGAFWPCQPATKAHIRAAVLLQSLEDLNAP